MHVNIERKEETKGIFSRRTLHRVTVSVTFTEEEQAIIKKAKIADDYALLFTINNYLDSGENVQHGAKFSKLMKGPFSRAFLSLSEATAWERELKERSLPALKRIIENEGGPSSSSTTLEF